MKNKVAITITFVVIFIIYSALFASQSGVGGDTTFVYDSMFKNFSLIPHAWNWSLNNGFGGFASPFTSSHLLTVAIMLASKWLSLSWNDVIRVVFILPFLLIGLVSSLMLIKTLLPGRREALIIFPIIFLSNSYVLLLMSGGQYVVALAYAFSPAVLYSFIHFLRRLTMKSSMISALLLGFLLMLDIRIGYVMLCAIGGLYLFSLLTKSISRSGYKRLVIYSLIIASVAILLQMFWLLPTIIVRQNPLSQLGVEYTAQQAVAFFSFAKFENALSLLHPNWPENIFGKTYFLRPEFLLLPLLAFGGLLLIEKTEIKVRQFVLFFSLLSLLGIFLAKGSNDPFGHVYLWLFDNAPGFIMFRDPTKWYILISLSYAFLISFTLSTVCTYLRKRTKERRILAFLSGAIVSGYFIWLLSPVFFGRVQGTFRQSVVPQDYQRLENFLSSQPEFFRTMWVPSTQRFGYSSQQHPSLAATQFYSTLDLGKIVALINRPSSLGLLQEAGIKYVVVPYDSEGEIFQKDRQYDPKQQALVINSLKRNNYLKKQEGFGMINVYVVPDPFQHFWLQSDKGSVESTLMSPIEYKIAVQNVKKGDKLIFNETFSVHWVASGDQNPIISEPYKDRYNSFILPKSGEYKLTIRFIPQQIVTYGLIISFATLLVVIGLLITLSLRRPNS